MPTNPLKPVDYAKITYDHITILKLLKQYEELSPSQLQSLTSKHIIPLAEDLFHRGIIAKVRYPNTTTWLYTTTITSERILKQYNQSHIDHWL